MISKISHSPHKRSHHPHVGDDCYQFDSFTEENIRKGFIRKVYSILCVQLVVTMIIITPFLYYEPVIKFAKANYWLMYVALALTFILMIVLACFTNIRRSFPLNIILLALFTVCEGFLLGVVSTFYGKDLVLMAVGITAVVSLALTLFAFQTKWDFTMYGGMLFVSFIILMCFGILNIFIKSRILHLAYSCIGALLFCAYLVYDTQIMLGGKHKYSLSPEDYIFAALNLYIDIIQLFLFILGIGSHIDN